jgi:hypothetical protein
MESAIERAIVSALAKLGYLTIKLPPLPKGMPDRLVLGDHGRMFFVELKDRNNVTSEHQDQIAASLSNRGFDVIVAYNIQDVFDWLNGLNRS